MVLSSQLDAHIVRIYLVEKKSALIILYVHSKEIKYLQVVGYRAPPAYIYIYTMKITPSH